MTCETKYYIEYKSVGKKSRIEISRHEFNSIVWAKRVLTSFFSITESYRIIVESYRAIERAKYDASLNHILCSNQFANFMNDRIFLNAPVIWYLSSCYFFHSAIKRLLPKVLLKEQIDTYNCYRNDVYEASKEYMFIESLRNYVTHRDLPVHTLRYANFKEDPSRIKESENVVSISLQIPREILEKDKKFKKHVLTEMPDMIDIILCIRCHLEGIWKLHNFIVENFDYVSENARKIISNAIGMIGEDDLRIPQAIATQDDNIAIEEEPLILYWDEARKKELENLGNLSHLSKRYITGKVKIQ